MPYPGWGSIRSGSGWQRRFPARIAGKAGSRDICGDPARQQAVALSLSPNFNEVLRVAKETRADILQGQAGTEEFPLARLRRLKAHLPEIAIIGAIPIGDESCIETARSFLGSADFLLLDSHDPHGYDPPNRQFGAPGRVHDWALSRRIVEDVPIPAILAGELGPDNVATAIAAVRPAGDDTKTRSDRIDGLGKDLDKVRDFVRAAKLAQ